MPNNSRFNTSHSTPQTTGKKWTPYRTSSNQYSTGLVDSLSKPPVSTVPSSNTPMSAPKQQYISSVAGGQNTPAVPGATNKPDYSGIMTGLKNLSTALGEGNKGQGTPQNPPPAPQPKDYYGQTRSALDAYIRSLTPSEAETNMSKRLSNLQESTRAGITRQEEDAIPMNFITGRQRVIENRGREMEAPLLSELNRMSTDRLAQSTGQKARYEFEQGVAKDQFGYDREDSRNTFLDTRDETRYNNGQLQMVDNNVVRIRPDGSSEVIYKGDPKVETQIIQSGGRNVLINSQTGAVIANLGATEGALSRAQSGASGGMGMPEISAAAQNILAQINRGADMNDLIKGTSKDAQKLRNEVYAALNAQGGYSDKSNDILTEGKDIVDSLIKGQAWKPLGGYSTKLGGKLLTGYGDADRQVQQLGAIMARDNLGLLKGAMSDADLAFIKSMSTGFYGEGVPSETYIKNTLEGIQNKLADRLGGGSAPKTRVVNGVTYTLQPDGTYEQQ